MGFVEPGLTRRNTRVPPEKAVRVAWVDERGVLKCTPGKCIDISERRIHIEVSAPIPLRARVVLSAGGKRISGPSTVKYLTQCNASFILVLE
jgi:hypothetical protein